MGAEEGPSVPPDCDGKPDPAGLIKRGDAEIGSLVDKPMQGKAWSAPGNMAIVITFDENDKTGRESGVQGCCGYDPSPISAAGASR
jgi:hypothetical protein